MSSTTFFSRFPDFNHDPTAPLLEEFERLASHRNWQPTSRIYGKNRNSCLIHEFRQTYGHDGSTRLDCWRALCAEVRVDPIPESITRCKKALSKVWVNIVDLMDARRAGTEVKRFESKEALRKYTRQTDRIFPRREAKKEGFVKVLLVHIVS